MKKRIDTAGFRLDPDDKTRLQREAGKRGLTVSSFIEKIINQYFAREKGLPGERDLTKYLDLAMEEILLSLADDGKISPDEAVRIAQPLIMLEAELFGCPDLTTERATA
jgi:hypothetical protein